MIHLFIATLLGLPQSFALSAISLKDGSGKEVGKAAITQAKGGVRIELQASGLAPGKHGIHFHETGKCEGPDFKSASGHLNPHRKQHGLDNPKGSHAGDLPNLEVADDGSVKTSFVAKGVKLGELKKASLIIHAQADDQKTDPSGDSGDRIACGVIATR